MTTEKELYSRIQPLLFHHGIPSRIENSIGSGLPDVVYVVARHIIFIELKVVRSGKIFLRPFQYSYAMRVQPHINNSHMWYLCDDKDVYKLFTFRKLKEFIIGDSNSGKITVNVRGIKPDFVLTNSLSVMQWILHIKLAEPNNESS